MNGSLFMLSPMSLNFEGDTDRVKTDPLSRFFAEDRAVRGAIARIMDDSIAASRAAHTAWEITRKGTLLIMITIWQILHKCIVPNL